MFDWDDLRHVLAVARAGTTAAAAQDLKVNATTTARRIAAIEQALAVRLFDKTLSGYAVTEAGARIVTLAERIEAEIASIQAYVAEEARRVSGTIRVTAPELLANAVLIPSIARFQAIYPDVGVEMIGDDRVFDLERGEADVALRAGARPDGGSLVVRKLADLKWAVYCGRDYAARRGTPASETELDTHDIIASDGYLSRLPGPIWLAEHAARGNVVYRCNSVSNLFYAIRAGLGVATFPCVIAEREPDVVRCLMPAKTITSDLWLITHERLRKAARVRAFMDFVVSNVGAIQGVLG